MLDHVLDDEEARKLLQSSHGDVARLCSRKDVLGRIHEASTLDVAVLLGSKQLLSHPVTQKCINDMWKGRSSLAGRVRLSTRDFPATWTLVLALPFSLIGVHVLPLDVNDLGNEVVEKLKQSGGSEYTVSTLWRWIDYFRIPLVKRANYIAADMLFNLLQIMVFFSRLCGEVNFLHHLLFVWVISKFVAELQQLAYNPVIYRRESSNVFEIVASILGLVSCIIRYFLIDEAGLISAYTHSASDIFDYFSKFSHSHTQPSGWFYVPAERPFQLEAEDRECPWTVELELLRLFAAVSVATGVLNFVEFFRLSHSTGVLLITVKEMIGDLVTWLKVVVPAGFAAAFCFSLLAPEYRVADTLENFSPPFIVIPGLSLDFSMTGPFFLPFWALMGHAEPADLGGAPGSSFAAAIFLWTYELLALVMLVNMSADSSSNPRLDEPHICYSRPLLILSVQADRDVLRSVQEDRRRVGPGAPSDARTHASLVPAASAPGAQPAEHADAPV